MDQIKCRVCKEFKNKKEFNKCIKRKTGHASCCRKCEKERRVERNSDPKKLEKFRKQRRKYKQRKKDKTRNNLDRYIKRVMTNRLKGFRRRQPNQINNITVNDVKLVYLEQEGLCKLSGAKMALEIGNDDSLSIDRIDSNFGYTKDNIQLTCVWANFMKQSMSNKEFLNKCQLIIDNTMLNN